LLKTAAIVFLTMMSYNVLNVSPNNDIITRVRTIVTIGLSLRPIVALWDDYRSR